MGVKLTPNREYEPNRGYEGKGGRRGCIYTPDAKKDSHQHVSFFPFLGGIFTQLSGAPLLYRYPIGRLGQFTEPLCPFGLQ